MPANTPGVEDRPRPDRPSVVVTILLILAPFALWLLVAWQLVFVVPARRRVFDDYAMQLPWLTFQVVGASAWFAKHWWILVPACVAIGGPVVTLGTLGVRHWLRSRRLRQVWGAVLILPPLAALVA